MSFDIFVLFTDINDICAALHERPHRVNANLLDPVVQQIQPDQYRNVYHIFCGTIDRRITKLLFKQDICVSIQPANSCCGLRQLHRQ